MTVTKCFFVFFKCLVLFQFEVSAKDNGDPSKSSKFRASVVVTVTRNTAPFFENTDFTGSISGQLTGKNPVFKAQGRDNDNDVRIFRTICLI